MVKNVTSLTQNGLRDWMVQRVSAVILASYVTFLLIYCLIHYDGVQHLQWQSLFSNTAMRIFNVMTLLSLMSHAWIGVWTISTDYLKSTSTRLTFQAVVALALFVYLIWGIQIFWGV